MHRPSVTPLKAGILTLVLIGLFAYFGGTKANPFADPFELKAMVDDARNLQPRSTVRMAGVDVGKVTKVEATRESAPAALVTMELDEQALPLREDAEVRVRPRIFLEGNYFVDLEPGSPSAPELGDGDTLPPEQASAAVSTGEVLAVLESDVRSDLRTLLFEYGTQGLGGGGAEGFNRAVPWFLPAYRRSSLANDALLGEDPDRDQQRILRGQQRTLAALAAYPRALQELVTDLNTTAGALAREDVALEQSVPALRDTLRTAMPALASLNEALPTLRTFATEAVPGVRSSSPTLDVAIPWIRQQRLLMRESELRGLARALRGAVPDLVGLNRSQVDFLAEARALASCSNHVLTPFSRSRIPSAEPGNTDQEVRRQVLRGLVGLAGESRNHDANTPYFHIQVVKPTNLDARNGGRLEPLSPPNPNVPPPHRPDVPCETQEPPNLDAPDGPGLAPSGSAPITMSAGLAAATRGGALAGTPFAAQARQTERLLESPLIRRRIERALGKGRIE
jgi:phospholipid/cholesterol/gamma-HCH transport system substrate-binding protein